MSFVDDLHLHAHELKEELNQDFPSAREPEAAAEAKAQRDPRDREEWSFDFSYTDSRGKQWIGRFTNKILNLGERQKAGILVARFNGGSPVHALPPDVTFINEALAHLEFSLTDRPPWAQDLQSTYDAGLIMALYNKAQEHERVYFRLPSPEAPSATSGSESGADGIDAGEVVEQEV